MNKFMRFQIRVVTLTKENVLICILQLYSHSIITYQYLVLNQHLFSVESHQVNLTSEKFILEQQVAETSFFYFINMFADPWDVKQRQYLVFEVPLLQSKTCSREIHVIFELVKLMFFRHLTVGSEGYSVYPIPVLTSADLKRVYTLLIQNGSIPTCLFRLVQHSVDASLPRKIVSLSYLQLHHSFVHKLQLHEPSITIN